jgi:hypothetical protein
MTFITIGDDLRVLDHHPGRSRMWHRAGVSIVFIVHDDVSMRESLGLTIRDQGWQSETFASAQTFLARPRAVVPSCLVLDLMLWASMVLSCRGPVRRSLLRSATSRVLIRRAATRAQRVCDSPSRSHPQRTGRPADALELGHCNEYQNDVVEVCHQITLPFMEIRFSSFPSNQLAYPAA